MIGYIYKITNVFNNKSYIGQTGRSDVNLRWKEHKRKYKNKNNSDYNSKFYRALRKYGLENFLWKIVKIVNAPSDEELRKLLNRWEKYYIKKYDTFVNGYNLTKGGDGCCVNYLRILMFDETEKLLKTFESSKSAAEILGVTKGSIQSCCSRNKFYTKIDDNRMIFRYENDTITEEDFKNLKRINYDKKILMFNMSGVLLRTFNSAKEISSVFKIAPKRITANCRSQSSFVLINDTRYIFKYKGDTITQNDLKRAHKIKSDPKIEVTAVDSVTDEILGKFDTLSEAGRRFNTHGHNISEVLSGKRKTAGKFNGHPIGWIKTSQYNEISESWS